MRDDIVRRYLMEELKVPDYKANVCVAFARGNIGRAKLLASSEDFGPGEGRSGDAFEIHP